MHKALYMIDFKNYFGFFSYFVGKMFSFDISQDEKITLYFPRFRNLELKKYRRENLISPFPFDVLGIDIDDWGKVISYEREGENLKSSRVQIRGLVVEVQAQVEDESLLYDFTTKWMEKILKNIAVLSPEATAFNQSKDRSAFINSVLRCGNVNILYYSDCLWTLHYVDLDMFGVVISNIKEEISIQYDSLYNAYTFMLENDARNFILSLATAIETCLRKVIQDNIFQNDDENLKKKYKKANGFSDLVKIVKKLNIPYLDNAIINNIMSIRNRVIHGGCQVVECGMMSYYREVRKFLESYNIPYFINQKSSYHLVLSKITSLPEV